MVMNGRITTLVATVIRHPLRSAGMTGSAIWVAAAGMSLLERRLTLDAGAEPPVAVGPLVSIIIPARNEARDIGRAVASHLSQTYRNIEVILVDDQSTDATSEVARQAANGDPRLRIVQGEPLPDGWVGKSWACHQGSRLARGEWLLFSDADVIHAPDTVGRCLAMAIRLGRGGLTIAPRVETGTVAERVVMPAAIQLIQTMVAPGPVARLSWTPITVAVGAFLLVRRDVYDTVDGHAGIGHHMVDDLQLAAAIKRSGHLLVPADGTRLLHLRMYRGTGEMWRGWRKNAAFASPRARSRGLAPALLLVALGNAPLGCTVAGSRRRDVGLGAVGAAGLAAQVLLQRTAEPVVATPRRYAPTLPLGTLFIAAAALTGAIDRITGRGPVWRGRRYPHASPRQTVRSPIGMD